MQGVEVLRTSAVDTLRSGRRGVRRGADSDPEMVNVQRTYTLTSFYGGTVYHLPQLAFTFQSSTTPNIFDTTGTIAVDTITSNQLQLRVYFPPMDSLFTPHDIKPPVQYPITLTETLPYVGSGLLLVALVLFALYYISQRRKNLPLFFKPKPKDPAHITAFRELEKVRKEKLWQQGKTKDFYTRISEIARVYIEDRYGIQAMEQTSDEILRAFDEAKCTEKALVDKLREVFYTSDLAKFAKYTPQPDENETSLSNIHFFVEKTKVEEEVKENV